MSYLASAQVRSVYPTAYRNHTLDPQADNTTEYNLVNMINRIGGRSFVISYDSGASGTSVALKASIGGYIFEISGAGVAALKSAAEAASSENIYLYIRLATADNSDYAFENTQLVDADGTGTSVNDLDAGSSFSGLGYGFTQPSGSDKAFVLALVKDDEWHVPSTSFVIMDTSKIGDGISNERTLAEGITTEDLDVTGDTNITGTLSATGATSLGSTLDVTGATTLESTLNAQGAVDFDSTLNVDGNTELKGTLTVGTSGTPAATTLNGATTINGTTTINNQATGFKVTGGTTTSKSLDIQADTTITAATTIAGTTAVNSGASVDVASSKTVDVNANLTVNNDTTIHSQLQVGNSNHTAKVTIKQTNDKNFTIEGTRSDSTGQTISFAGTSSFQGGNYASVTGAGSEQVTVGGNVFNIVTRDTNQDNISGNKTFTGTATFNGSSVTVGENTELYFKKLKAASYTVNSLLIGEDGRVQATSLENPTETQSSATSLRYVSAISQTTYGKVSYTTKQITIASGDAQGQLKINGTNYSITGLTSNESGSTTFSGLNISGLTASRAVSTDASKNLVSTDLSSPTSAEKSTTTLTYVTGISQTAVGKVSYEYKEIPAHGDGQTGLITAESQAIYGTKYFTGTTYFGASGATTTNQYIDASGSHMPNYYVTSDRRLKKDIKEYIPEKSILDLPVVEFTFKETGNRHIGCIAQDLQRIEPKLVHETEAGYLNIDENKLVYLLLLEVKKLKEEIKELKGE